MYMYNYTCRYIKYVILFKVCRNILGVYKISSFFVESALKLIKIGTWRECALNRKEAEWLPSQSGETGVLCSLRWETSRSPRSVPLLHCNHGNTHPHTPHSERTPYRNKPAQYNYMYTHVVIFVSRKKVGVWNVARNNPAIQLYVYTYVYMYMYVYIYLLSL